MNLYKFFVYKIIHIFRGVFRFLPWNNEFFLNKSIDNICPVNDLVNSENKQDIHFKSSQQRLEYPLTSGPGW